MPQQPRLGTMPRECRPDSTVPLVGCSAGRRLAASVCRCLLKHPVHRSVAPSDVVHELLRMVLCAAVGGGHAFGIGASSCDCWGRGHSMTTLRLGGSLPSLHAIVTIVSGNVVTSNTVAW